MAAKVINRFQLHFNIPYCVYWYYSKATYYIQHKKLGYDRGMF